MKKLATVWVCRKEGNPLPRVHSRAVGPQEGEMVSCVIQGRSQAFRAVTQTPGPPCDPEVGASRAFTFLWCRAGDPDFPSSSGNSLSLPPPKGDASLTKRKFPALAVDMVCDSQGRFCGVKKWLEGRTGCHAAGSELARLA